MEGRVLKVMLVEDDPDYLEIYRLWLQKVGHEVLVAADGKPRSR